MKSDAKRNWRVPAECAAQPPSLLSPVESADHTRERKQSDKHTVSEPDNQSEASSSGDAEQGQEDEPQEQTDHTEDDKQSDSTDNSGKDEKESAVKPKPRKPAGNRLNARLGIALKRKIRFGAKKSKKQKTALEAKEKATLFIPLAYTEKTKKDEDGKTQYEFLVKFSSNGRVGKHWAKRKDLDEVCVLLCARVRAPVCPPCLLLADSSLFTLFAVSVHEIHGERGSEGSCIPVSFFHRRGPRCNIHRLRWQGAEARREGGQNGMPIHGRRHNQRDVDLGEIREAGLAGLPHKPRASQF